MNEQSRAHQQLARLMDPRDPASLFLLLHPPTPLPPQRAMVSSERTRIEWGYMSSHSAVQAPAIAVDVGEQQAGAAGCP